MTFGPGRWEQDPTTLLVLCWHPSGPWRRRMAVAQVDVGRLIGTGQDVATDDEHDPEGVGLALRAGERRRSDERARDQLTRIDNAADRLARAGYARCVVCEQQIPTERLQALPTATTCPGCSPVRRPTARPGS